MTTSKWAIKNNITGTYLRLASIGIILFDDKPTAREYLKMVNLDPDIYEVVRYDT